MPLEVMHFAAVRPSMSAPSERDLGNAALRKPADKGEQFIKDAASAEFLVEAYATAEGRDAALGPCGQGLERVPVNHQQVGTGGTPSHRIAIGHRVGECGFEAVLTTIAGHVAANFESSGQEAGEITAGGIVYSFDSAGRPIRSEPLLSRKPSAAEILTTQSWIWKELGARLAHTSSQGED